MELLNRIEANFVARISQKTLWGRREILAEYRKAVQEELIKGLK